MDEIVKEFLIESSENLDMLDRAMVELEKDPRHKPSLDNVFRTIHTVKGTCGFIGFGRLEKLSHTGENLLSKIRDGKLALNADRTSALLAMVDAIRMNMATIEQTGQEANETYDTIIARLVELTENDAPALPPLAPISPPVAKKAARRTGKPARPAPVVVAEAAPSYEEEVPVTAHHAAAAEAKAVPEVSANKAPSLSESTIRVDVNVLDKLMNLVGELVLARNQILQFSDSKADKTYLNACQRLNMITTEIQESFMKTRMQPIENVFGRFPRIIRDLSNELGKQIRLEVHGSETELDRTIIEAIKDPLTHIIRNSVDHGIETPERRVASGKQPEGELVLRAFHEGGQVNIEIADNGAGLNSAKLKQKAFDKGLISFEEMERMNEREAFNLIFLPGFSTAEKITNVSGRGVGMDVVRTNIAKIGGSVEILSELGKGTTLKIRIPLTLAILPALMVTAGGDRFAIPQASLVELVRLEGERSNKIELVHGAPVYRLRGKLLPLAYLARELEIESMAIDGVNNIVVLQADGRQFGLVVDGISDTEEIVVKPLSKHLKDLDCFAGATIMGDGQVALILDVLAVAQRAKVIAEVQERSVADRKGVPTQEDASQTLLLLEGANGGRIAIPLSMVARLERFKRAQVETSANRTVTQYRGEIMPLIRLDDFLPGAAAGSLDDHDPMQVVVYSSHGRSIGLVVERISDIVHEAVSMEQGKPREGILGSTIVHQRVTDLIDLPGIIRSADPSFFDEQPTAETL